MPTMPGAFYQLADRYILDLLCNEESRIKCRAVKSGDDSFNFFVEVVGRQAWDKFKADYPVFAPMPPNDVLDAILTHLQHKWAGAVAFLEQNDGIVTACVKVFHGHHPSEKRRT